MKPAVVCEFDYQYPELKIKLKRAHTLFNMLPLQTPVK